MEGANRYPERAVPPIDGDRTPTRCLSCGAMHLNDGFKCNECLEKESWKPDQWTAYREQHGRAVTNALSVGQRLGLAAAVILILCLVLRATLFRPPTQAQILTEQGQHYFEQGQYSQAIQSYLAALDHNPPSGPVTTAGTADNLRWRIAYNYNLLGGAAYSSKDYDDAVRYGQQALSYDPTNPILQSNLAMDQAAVTSRRLADSQAMTTVASTPQPQPGFDSQAMPPEEVASLQEGARCGDIRGQVTSLRIQVTNAENSKPDSFDFGGENSVAYQLAVNSWQQKVDSAKQQESAAEQQATSMGCSE